MDDVNIRQVLRNLLGPLRNFCSNPQSPIASQTFQSLNVTGLTNMCQAFIRRSVVQALGVQTLAADQAYARDVLVLDTLKIPIYDAMTLASYTNPPEGSLIAYNSGTDVFLYLRFNGMWNAFNQAGPEGPRGFQGFQGFQGYQGLQGTQGNQGFQGPT